MSDVMCIGIAGVDVLIRGVDLKTDFSGETKLAESVELELGGDAANEAIVLSRLGADVALMSGIGSDSAGNFVRERLKNAGVCTKHLIRLPAGISSALNVIIVHPDGERNFINTGAPAAGWKPDLRKLGDAKIISLASFGLPPFTDSDTCLATAKAAKELGKIVCADMVVTQDLSLEKIGPALAYVDYIFPNEEEARILTGKDSLDDIADEFLKYGTGNVIIKTGSKGCFIKSAELRAFVPAYRCENVVDTTGAGDNFLAGFICELLNGKSVTECCKFACAVAAVSIQKRGASTGVTSRQQVERVIQFM